MEFAQIERRLEKMSSLGNRFLIVDNLDGALGCAVPQHIFACIHDAEWKRYALFDQMLLLEPNDNETADFRMRTFNLDKTEAGQCGNGVRCAARYAHDRGFVAAGTVRIQTRDCEITAVDSANTVSAAECSAVTVAYVHPADVAQVEANMGQPVFTPRAVPFCVAAQADYYALQLDNLPPHLSQKCHRMLRAVGVVSMGNPHVVMLTDSIDYYDADEFDVVGKAFQQQRSLFPQRVNVGIMQVQTCSSIRLRVYERGVGETQACGSGACAAVAIGERWGLLDDAVQIEMPGGMLTVRRDTAGNLTLTGPVEFSWASGLDD